VDATAEFAILTDDTGQRVLSVSARNVPTEFEVYYTVYYTVRSGEKTLLEPQLQTLTRDYTYDETRVLGKAREEELLRKAIVDDLVRLVLVQVSSIQQLLQAGNCPAVTERRRCRESGQAKTLSRHAALQQQYS